MKSFLVLICKKWDNTCNYQLEISKFHRFYIAFVSYPSASSQGSGGFLNLWSIHPPPLEPFIILGARDPQEYI